MNIVMTFDDGYAPHAAVVMVSLCCHNPGSHVFYVVSRYLEPATLARLTDLLRNYDCTLEYIVFADRQVDGFPIGKGTANDYVKVETYFRLFLSDLLPPSVNKVLYLDSDIVVNGSVNELWEWEFGQGKCMAGVEDKYRNTQRRPKHLGYPLADSYFNAGVLVIDMNRLRRCYSVSHAIDYIREKGNEIIFHDQDVLNGLLHGCKEFLPIKFNALDYYYMKGAVFPPRYNSQREDLLYPVVIHYSGRYKPWMQTCRHPFRLLYYKYLNMTPWQGVQPVSGSPLGWWMVFHQRLNELLNIRHYTFDVAYNEAVLPYL